MRTRTIKEINDRLVEYLLQRMLDGTITTDPDDGIDPKKYDGYFEDIYAIFPEGKVQHWRPEMVKAVELYNALPLNRALREENEEE
jgi:hypothetical protein